MFLEMDPAEIIHSRIVYQRQAYGRYPAISDGRAGQGVEVEPEWDEMLFLHIDPCAFPRKGRARHKKFLLLESDEIGDQPGAKPMGFRPSRRCCRSAQKVQDDAQGH